MDPKIEKYLKSLEVINDEILLDEDYYEMDEYRNYDLIRFVDDFVQSEDFNEQLEIIKGKPEEKDELQKEPSLITVEEMPEKYPLTKETRKLWTKRRCKEIIYKNKINKTILENQRKAISKVRKYIKQARLCHMCHARERALLCKKEREKLFDTLQNECKVDTTHIPLYCHMIDKVVTYRKIRHAQITHKKQRLMNVIYKLLKEYKRQKQIDEQQNKTYDYKVVRKETILKDMEVVGTKIILKSRYEEKPETPTEPEIPEALEETKKTKTGKEKKNKQDDKKKKDVPKSKKEKSTKSKKEKSIKEKAGKKTTKEKQAVEILDLILPYVPITNVRATVTYDETSKMIDVIQEIEKIPVMKQHRAIFEREKWYEGTYPVDGTFHWVPKVLIFKNFKNGMAYTKQISIINGGSTSAKCRWISVNLHDGWLNSTIEVEPVGAQYLIPGALAKVKVTFVPYMCTLDTIEGNLKFKTYKSANDLQYQFTIPIKCVPLTSGVKAYPNELTFDPLPIWKAKRNINTNKKILKVVNSGGLWCEIKIHKKPEIVPTYEYLNKPSQTSANFEGPYISNRSSYKKITETEHEMLEIDNAFAFNQYYFKLDKESETQLHIYFQNIDHVGNYFERYLLNVYEPHHETNTLFLKESQEITIQAEITGQYITIDPEQLDFQICVVNTVYQLNLKIFNRANLPHGVGLKFPSCLKDFLSCSANDIYIQPNRSQTVTIRFFPREQIISDHNPYYNPHTCILEFPVQVCVLSKNYLDTPPTMLIVYAILSKPIDFQIVPADDDCVSCQCNSDECVLNMGICTTRETIYSNLYVINNTFVPQHIGFFNLPECITIFPNYGFDEIYPQQIKTYKLLFSPEIKDIPDYELKGDAADSTVKHCIRLNTIKNMGGFTQPRKKQQITSKRLRKSLELVEEELRRGDSSLEVTMASCVQDLRKIDIFPHGDESLEIKETPTIDFNQEKNEDDRNSETTTASKSICNVGFKKLSICATIINPMCDLSHQFVQFPDTPCGSYTTVTVYLNLLEYSEGCCCGYVKLLSQQKREECEISFKVVGNNPEIFIEPICGTLQKGQTRLKMTLIAKPQVPPDVIKERARLLKWQHIYEEKRKALEAAVLKKWEAKMKQESTKKGSKGSKGGKESKGGKASKGGKDKKKDKGTSPSTLDGPDKGPPPIPEVIVKDEEVIVDYLDLYPAELSVWPCIEPYTINAQFNFLITYSGENVTRHPEKLYLDATCKVIRPSFIHNLNVQHINFGPTIIGTSSRKILAIQNIEYEAIVPKVTLLSPLGPFTCPEPINLSLQPEYILQFPLTYRPFQATQDIEYFEIISGNTICPLIVGGEGVEPDFKINPDFVVCRLQASVGGFADCSIEINNLSGAPLIIAFLKTCELEGFITPIEKPNEKQSDKKQMQAKKNEKPKKIQKFSSQLNEDEEYSLQNSFTFKEGESFYEVMGGNGNVVETPAFTKKVVKIRFGIPVPPAEGDKKGKKGKGNKSKTNKKSKGSSKSSTKGPVKTYVAKYNLVLGQSKLIKDIIVMASFV